MSKRIRLAQTDGYEHRISYGREICSEEIEEEIAQIRVRKDRRGFWELLFTDLAEPV